MNAKTYMDRVHGIRPKHRAYAPVDQPSRGEVHFVPEHEAEPLFELKSDVATEELRIDLAAFLIEEKGWPPNAFTVHAVGMFAASVFRRYVRVQGHEPRWDRGPVYSGFTDYLIVRDTYDEEMGALVEQLAHEGVA